MGESVGNISREANPKLLDCPFCGSKGIYRVTRHWNAESFEAGCPEGHATSPEFTSRAEAAEWWNSRPKSRRRARQVRACLEGGDA